VHPLPARGQGAARAARRGAGGLTTPTALIAGITGQDGSYLAEFLIAKGYEVHGIIRRASSFNTERIDHLYLDPHDPQSRLKLHYGDLSDGTGLRRILEIVRPQEVYNLGAQSHVKVSFEAPEYTADIVASGTLRLLEAVRDYVQIGGTQARVYQAGSSEMFGAAAPPQSERTPFYPRSPYAAAKLYAHWMTVNYRESFGLHTSSGILFNHESPLRGIEFVTRKVTDGVARIKLGLARELHLGNLNASRDWGHARDYVQAMWLMLQQETPDDFVIATGRTTTISEFCRMAFAHVGLEWQEFVRTESELLRPAEVELLRGDAGKARQRLGWQPTTTLEAMIAEMFEADLARYRSRTAVPVR